MDQTKALYRRVVRKGKKDLNKIVDIDGVVRKVLSEKGLKKREIDTAISLMSCILYFDSRIFPDNHIGHCKFSYGKQKPFVKYNHPSDGEHPIEHYGVRAKELPQDLKKGWRAILYEKDGSPTMDSFEGLPLMSYQQKLLAIAAHEVRHRLQRNGVRMFFSDTLYADEQIKSYARLLRGLFDSGKDYGDVDDPTKKAQEFDARMVEKLFIFELCNGARETKLLEVIKIEGEIAETN